jgi:predicted metal-dependent phosphoesterase TrpH
LKKLKVDFHIHTAEDPQDRYIEYSAKQLLDKAAEYHFDVITIANHTMVLYTDEIREYAEQRGILLIPGIEVYVERKHVLIVNCEQPYRGPLTFENVRSYAGEDALIIAPHPFYPRDYCLKEELEKHIEVFDAIEYSHLHFRLVNFNKKAVAIAEKYDLPMVGTSDAHTFQQLNTTYSLVEAQKTIPAIITAIKNRHVEVVTSPISSWKLVTRIPEFLFSLTRRFIRKNLSAKPREY